MSSKKVFKLPTHPFRQSDCIKVMKDVLKSRLEDADYEAEIISQLTKEISDEIRTKVRDLGFPQYKLAIQVIITEQKTQGMKVDAQAFWDTRTDNFATYTFKNEHIIATAVCFAAYFSV
ncbi:Dynein light chain Tctex-1 like protein [Aduncisulcus paluster]|uniref:Dynein light chain Tctex-1 like protein n=1 Tax=Aduncisulcus paluster TaxID=2918883 RepID=A0ABQ5KWC4_9EUKA|nr:Dynein light chain Tctex-1 like protein [Aduncisulcus paluster]